MLKLAIIISEYNSEITEGLRRGAYHFLKEQNICSSEIDEYRAPGAFELPLIAQKLARTQKYAGIICLGCVIKGETAHFEFISLAASYGMMQSMLKAEIPITFGVLTVYSEDQAVERSQADSMNKGREAAAACLKVVETLNEIEKMTRNAIQSSQFD